MNFTKLIKKIDIVDIIIILLLTVLCLLTIYPIIYVFFASLSDGEALQLHTGLLIRPIGFSLEAYKAVLSNPVIITGYKNTIFYVIVGTSINLMLTSLGAYALSRKDFYIGKFITIGIIITMQFSGGLIPTYILVHNLLGSTRWTMLLPGAIATMNLIIMRTSFQSIPESVIESARIDGASDVTILNKIVLPLSKPVLAVMTLYYGVAHWNQWFQASIYLRDRNLFPLQLFLREIVLQNQLDETVMGMEAGMAVNMGEVVKYATIMVAIIPVLIVYPFLQKHFTKGVMLGAVKE